MRKYIYVRVRCKSYLEIFATDPSVLDWIFNEVKRHIPDCIKKEGIPDSMGTRVFCQIEKFPSVLIDRWGITRLLCENGYEPFAVEAETTHFRRMIEE